ncbi:non-ribosomal peptide synthetase [Acrocarpospora catenulata]|uniref:non-ribosomal peptide synthetase n=1 Tax=Acrocarpospora catenulata TaxID=2836182 RepID=UPI001BD9EEEA|nr:non-ribosomal peptide synthetase [Acrocarpospora catenulata]
MTPAQLRVWFLQRFDPADASFNLHRVRRLTGPLDRDALARAVTAVSARHATLRTRFPEVDGGPVAVVDPPAPVPMEWLEADEAEAVRLVAERTNRPFDLGAEIPFRVTVLSLAPDVHVLAFVLHHIAADGWSLDVLMSDFTACYEGTAPPPLPLEIPPPPEVNPKDLAYWVDRLADPPTLELPTDHPRPAERRGYGDEIAFRIAAPLAAALAELAKRERCTLFTVLLAAYQVLLARHTGQDDLCVGVPDAGRDTDQAKNLVANLSGMLVLRGDLSGDPAFTEFLRRTKLALLGALTRRTVPFERLVDELDVGRDLSTTPFYQTTLTLHATELERTHSVGGLLATPFPHGWHWVRNDLTVDLWWAGDDSGELAAIVRYSTELFDRATVASLFERFQVLLHGIAAEPTAQLSRLPLLDAAERDQLVRAWNATGRPLPEPATLLSLFQAQVARTPDAVAAIGGVTLTYRELDTAAGRVAGRLAAEGAGPGTVVALCLNRSAALLPALLGVLRTGAAYLPIDPENPEARIAYLVADSGAALALTEPTLRDRLPDDLPTVDLAEAMAAPPAGHAAHPQDEDAKSPGEAQPGRGGPDDPAYLLYTSGSTGRPKGVVIPHSALVNLLVGFNDLLAVGPEHVWMVLSSVSFDISALELYLPLITGGRAVIVDRDSAVDGAAQLALIKDTGITHIQATPSGWRVLIEAGFADPAITGLVGGEALPDELARDLRPRLRRLLNVYGPTETTIWSTTWEVPADPGDPRIGAPIANTQVYVLDAAGEIAPTGVPGELLIGGAGVATGYHRRPGLTAERFVPDPFGGGRLYRTGDRARWRADGQIEFLGRLDNQLKVRGFRIEPGEIEAAILACPGVTQAAVVARGEILIAYVVGPADLTEVREQLERTLPQYMMPALWTRLPTLPLTISGKIDRKSLPDPVPDRAAAYVEPSTDAERLVAEIWSEVLGLDKIGARDDFFTVGGHSLIAVRVAARLRATIDLDIPIRTLFTRRTVTDLAHAIEDLLTAELEQMSEDEAAKLAGA